VHLLPFFGALDIRDITREQVKQWGYEKLQSGLSFSSVQKYLAPLSEMFNHAVEDGHIEQSPCLRVLRSNRGGGVNNR